MTTTRFLTTVSFAEGEQAVIECQVVGNPTSVTWLVNEKLVPRDTVNYIQIREANNIYKLIIRAS